MAGELDIATYGPMLPGNDRVAFGDLPDLERKLGSGEYAGFIVEPLQSYGGVHLPPDNYLIEASAAANAQAPCSFSTRLRPVLAARARCSHRNTGTWNQTS